MLEIAVCTNHCNKKEKTKKNHHHHCDLSQLAAVLFGRQVAVHFARMIGVDKPSSQRNLAANRGVPRQGAANCVREIRGLGG